MGTLTYSHTLVAGTNQNVNDVQDMFNDAKAVLNGNINEENLSTGTKDKLSLNDGSTVRRGRTVVTPQESLASTTYSYMPTPDRVSSVVVGTGGGLLFVLFKALFQGPVSVAGKAAIFINGSQLTVNGQNSAPAVQEASATADATPNWTTLFQTPFGVQFTQSSASDESFTAAPLPFASGSISPGTLIIDAPAGTYDVGVQFKSASGTLLVKERKLAVWSMSVF